MDYPVSPLHRRLLSGLPIEARLNGAPLARIIERLRSERRLQSPPKRALALAVCIAVEREPDLGLALSLHSVALQSHAAVRALVLAPDESWRARLTAFINELPARPAYEILASWNDARDTLAQSADRVAFLRHGDALHPSAAAWITLTPGEIVTFDELQCDANGVPVRIQRNPALETATLRHIPYLRQAFACDARLAARYPGDLAREMCADNLHRFQIWLTQQQNINWRRHPECFLIAAPRASAADLQTPDAFAAIAQQFDFIAGECERPYRLAPRRRAERPSVIIPYRDKPELTARALASLAKQTAAERLDIVLIDNQSAPETNTALARTLAELPALRVRTIAYDHPFNHSAECNLGVAESTGDVIIFMNNDVELISPNALEDMAAWALTDGVATVGATLRDPDTGDLSAGFKIRAAPVAAHDSIVEESSHPHLTPHIHNVFGNTFALAALPRSVFETLGPLDHVRFPNGFNDVEFACRARSAGLAHIALGHVHAVHARGASRARTDETPQKLLLRQLYPQAIAEAQQNSLQMIELPPPEPAPAAARSQTAKAVAGGAKPQPPQSAFQRAAFRLSQTRFAQHVLRDPFAHRVVQGAWRLITLRRP